MQPPSDIEGLAEGLPLTHQAYMAACSAGIARPFVQVRKRFRNRPETLCGRVADIACGDRDWFKVDTTTGSVWAEARNVRMCSGDGRCTCELEEVSRTGHRYPVQDVPIGDQTGAKHSPPLKARKNVAERAS